MSSSNIRNNGGADRLSPDNGAVIMIYRPTCSRRMRAPVSWDARAFPTTSRMRSCSRQAMRPCM